MKLKETKTLVPEIKDGLVTIDTPTGFLIFTLQEYKKALRRGEVAIRNRTAHVQRQPSKSRKFGGNQ